MIYQLTEVEYCIIDQLADGPEPITYLLQQMSLTGNAWESSTVLNALSHLMEKQFPLPSIHAANDQCRCALYLTPATSGGRIAGWACALLVRAQ